MAVGPLGRVGIVLNNHTKCPCCGSSDLRRDYSLPWSDDRFTGYDIVSCGSCSITFADPFPDTETLQRLYDSLQYQDVDRKGGNPNSATAAELQSMIERESAFVEKYASDCPARGNVLDVGAGWGLLLKQFENRGWTPYGVELSKIQSQFAQERLELNVYQTSVEQMDSLELPHMDLVVMRHTLEHFFDPQATIRLIHEYGAPGSKLIIEVPDYDSYDRRAYGESWPGFGPWHLWYFSEKTLRRLLTENGFQPLRFERFLSDRIFGNRSSTVSRLLRKSINRLGGKHVFSGRSIGVIAQRTT